MQDALEVRIAHAHFVHVVERVADVIDARPPSADSLRHEARAAVQVELAHVRRVRGIGDERKRTHGPRSDLYWDEARLVHAARHLPVPQPGERAAQARLIDAVGHAPARAAAAQSHHEAGLALRAAIARGQDAERAVIPVCAAERPARIVEARRPHEGAVAEYPEISLRQPSGEFAQGH